MSEQQDEAAALEMTKAKVKKTFRHLKSKLTTEIQSRLDHVNGQVKKIEATLDKKYGGMYKVLIHQFLTNQDQKIYNLEILGLAVKETLSEHIYTKTESTENFEEFCTIFNKSFDEKLLQVKERLDLAYAEKGKVNGNIQEEGKESSEAPSEEGQEETTNI